MVIGGLEKLTLLDYPDHLAAIIFTQGCNFRCHFCYNPTLVLPRVGLAAKEGEKGLSSFTPADLFSFLRERFGRLEGVVITGGEPTLQADLPDFIKRIKDIGYLVKLDTNGTNPDMLRELLRAGLIDYLAMDIKAPLDRYQELVGAPVNCKNLQESVKIIMMSDLPYEFRTTVVQDVLTPADFPAMGELIRGAKKWYLQSFKSDAALVNPAYRDHQAYGRQEMEELAEIGRKYVSFCQVRI
jgi:pyruvate formate lyase activating enzyme